MVHTRREALRGLSFKDDDESDDDFLNQVDTKWERAITMPPAIGTLDIPFCVYKYDSLSLSLYVCICMYPVCIYKYVLYVLYCTVM